MGAVSPAGPEPMITTLASTRSSPARTIDDGPPGFWVAVASSTIEIEKPPNGLELMNAIVACGRYSPGVSRQGPELGDHVASHDLEGARIGQASHADHDMVGAGVRVLAEPVQDVLGGLGAVTFARRDVDVLERRVLDLVRVPSDGSAVLGE